MSTAMRLYSPEEATRTLPLVRRIVDDIVRAHRRWREIVTELELAATIPASEEPAGRTSMLEREAQGLAAELDAFTRELSILGITLKDRRMGLVDFPAERDGRLVWLCWRLGEPSVQYWHEWDAGFGGRQPLDPELVASPAPTGGGDDQPR
jgi:hypothetical protein